MTDLILPYIGLLIVPIALPLIYIAWVMSPWSVREGSKAAKYMVFATYPRVSIGGNNPASQRVHEGGGLRFSALVSFIVMMLATVIVLLATSVDILWLLIIQTVAGMITFIVTLYCIDIAEHGAESIHGDSVELDPKAQQWLDRQGFATYRQGEVWRMTQKGQDYEDMTPAQFDEEMRKREWASKIIIWLARW